MLGRSVSTTADIEQHFNIFIQLAATEFPKKCYRLYSVLQMERVSYRLKTQHYYSFSQLYIIFKESLYTISTSVNPPDPAIFRTCLLRSRQSKRLTGKTIGLPGGMSIGYIRSFSQTTTIKESYV